MFVLLTDYSYFWGNLDWFSSKCISFSASELITTNPASNGGKEQLLHQSGGDLSGLDICPGGNKKVSAVVVVLFPRIPLVTRGGQC